MNIKTLKENMKRFGTKNLNEQGQLDRYNKDDILRFLMLIKTNANELLASTFAYAVSEVMGGQMLNLDHSLDKVATILATKLSTLGLGDWYSGSGDWFIENWDEIKKRLGTSDAMKVSKALGLDWNNPFASDDNIPAGEPIQ